MDIDKLNKFLKYYHVSQKNQYNTVLLHLMILKNNNYTNLYYLIKDIRELYNNDLDFGMFTLKIIAETLIELDIVTIEESKITISHNIEQIEIDNVVYMCEYKIPFNVFMRKMKINQLRNE